MRTPKTALLLVGSPKPGASSSASLGAYLLEELALRGVGTETVHVGVALRSAEATEALHAAVAAADLVVLSFPLYVDSLPAHVVRALELVAERCGAASEGAAAKASFAAICQCGFPEAEHCEMGLEICRRFAEAAGFDWAGGLAMGEGGMTGGRPLREVRGMMRAAVRALDLSAAALAEGGPVPDEAVRLMATPAIPKVAYRAMANLGWRMDRRKQHATAPLDARPFADAG